MDFLAAAVDHKKLITTENIEKAFALFDTNKDGSIDVEDFKAALPKPNMDTRASRSTKLQRGNSEDQRRESISKSVLDAHHENVDTEKQFNKDN